MQNKLVAKDLLRRYGLYKKDMKYFRVKKRILRKLGHLPNEKKDYTDHHLHLLSSDEGDKIVKNALKVWEKFQLEQLRVLNTEKEEEERRYINSDGEIEAGSDVDFFDIKKEAEKYGLH